jgi:hypothetical protein
MDDIFLQAYLAPGETLLWSGSPTAKLRIERQHVPHMFMLFFVFCFLAIPIIGGFVDICSKPQAPPPSLVVGGEATPNISPQGNNPPPQHRQTRGERIFTGLFLILFFGGICLILAVLTINNVSGGTFAAKSTVYGITDQRILIVTGKSKKVVTSLLLSTLNQVQMEQWPDGLGTISFGMPRELSKFGYPASPPTLENISEPLKVFQFIGAKRAAR